MQRSGVEFCFRRSFIICISRIRLCAVPQLMMPNKDILVAIDSGDASVSENVWYQESALLPVIIVYHLCEMFLRRYERYVIDLQITAS